MLVSRTALLGGTILAATFVTACHSSDTSTTGGTAGSGGSGGSSTTTGTTTTTSSSSTTGSSGSLADDPPQVVNNGGTVLTSPKIQLIVYAEDPDATDAQAFLEEFASTPSWAAQTAEYGVGAVTVLPPIMIPGTPPTKLVDQGNGVTPFQQTLVSNISGASPAWGAADPSTIYMFQLPKGTNVESYGSCCSSFLGYHEEVAVDTSTSVAYGISCNCGVVQGSSLTALQWVTTTLSHESVEAATDPFPFSNLAWSGTDANHLAWSVATGGEIADMCEFNADSNYIPPGAKYMVQRSWSNAAAKAGNNPCVPVPPTGPYFNSIPVLSDTVQIASQFGGDAPTKGVTIPVGTTKTVSVKLEAAGTTSGPWTVTALDFNYYSTGQSPYLDLSFGGTPTSGQSNSVTGSAGDVLTLTIKSLSADSQDGSAIFVLLSDLGKGADLQENISFGAVGN